MSNVIEITPHNTVMEESQVVYNPVYCQVPAAAKLFNVSKSTIYKWLRQYDEDSKGVEWLYVDYSSTLTLINIEKLEQFLKQFHKKYY